MVRCCSRNTKIENRSDVSMTLEARWDPPPGLHNSVTIPPREYKYVCHSDFDNEGNRYRFLDIWFVAEDASVRVLTSDIRENAEIRLNYDRSHGTITFTPIKGSVIRRLGLSIMLSSALRKIKSSLKQIGTTHVREEERQPEDND